MLPFTKPKIEELVQREIVLTDLNKWTNKGTIWTPNNIDYNFVYRVLERVIVDISMGEEDVRFLKGNIFFYNPRNKAGRFIHKYNEENLENPNFKRLSQILDNATIYYR